ncbi:MAG: L,D-transpeptidase/peptidoglycan binding protein [Lachnospiraceae bacterium]|nr:L,D-transpeptidase/peptidoglycan binding protein [Lachnospiraceae bacterium]
MKIKGTGIAACIVSFIVLLIAGYLAIGFYYQDGFAAGTFINGLYCTGMRVEEVNEQLISCYEDPGFTITFADGTSQVLMLSDVGGSVDYKSALQKIKDRQTPLFWGISLLSTASETTKLLPVITVDETAFTQVVSALPQVVAEETCKREVALQLTGEDGYTLIHTKQHILDTDRAIAESMQAMQNGEQSISLEMAGLYEDPELTAKEQELIDYAGEISAFLNFTISIDLGDQTIAIGHPELSFLLQTSEDPLTLLRDENGSFLWDSELIAAFAETFADTYSTYGKSREFVTSSGESVTIDAGTYGSEIDADALNAFLQEAIPARCDQTYVPEYTREAYVRGVDDIGGHYIEIDLTGQTLYYYKDHTLVLSTPVVTGNLLRHRETPPGAYYIYLKQQNRTLKGPNYSAHVNYWMPIKKGIGIHDALWRDEFGGDIYETDGSHGCINTPLEAMEILYEQTEVGVPVILYE